MPWAIPHQLLKFVNIEASSVNIIVVLKYQFFITFDLLTYLKIKLF